MTIEAIETMYSGIRFRSRLEARWARFFDAASVEWEYEPRAFRLSGGEGYLPDFWIPRGDCYFEIKPLNPLAREVAKALSLHESTGNSVFVLLGHPGNFRIRCAGEADRLVTLALRRGYRPSRDARRSLHSFVIGVGGGRTRDWELAVRHAWNLQTRDDVETVGRVLRRFLCVADIGEQYE